eukprot:scaffold31118_cov43-Phaeocystis_antarctica.AAC.1
MVKTPFFLRRDAFERTLSAMDYFLEDSRGKSNSAPAYVFLGRPHTGGSGATCCMWTVNKKRHSG